MNEETRTMTVILQFCKNLESEMNRLKQESDSKTNVQDQIYLLYQAVTVQSVLNALTEAIIGEAPKP